MPRARKSTDEYIMEAIQAANFAQSIDLAPKRRTLNLGAGTPSRRYPSRPPVDSHAGHNHGGMTSSGEDIGPIIQQLVRESGGRVTIVSGKRSPERQAQLFAAAVKKYGSVAAARKWVAPPGRSKHQTGAAYDLGGDLNLAAQLASKYGLYRPMAHEPWHFEKIGSRRK